MRKRPKTSQKYTEKFSDAGITLKQIRMLGTSDVLAFAKEFLVSKLQNLYKFGIPHLGESEPTQKKGK